MRAALVLTGLLLLLGASCTPGQVQDCTCIPCDGFALDLAVVDADSGDPVEDFVVEVVLNGAPLGQPESCAPEEREGNRCTLGSEAGYYHLIFTAPGYQQLEKAVRYAGEGGGICCRECILPQSVVAELTAR